MSPRNQRRLFIRLCLVQTGLAHVCVPFHPCTKNGVREGTKPVLLFEGSDSKVRVSPATDDCGAISIDGRMYEIDLYNKTTLFDIIR